MFIPNGKFDQLYIFFDLYQDPLEPYKLRLNFAMPRPQQVFPFLVTDREESDPYYNTSDEGFGGEQILGGKASLKSPYELQCFLDLVSKPSDERVEEWLLNVGPCMDPTRLLKRLPGSEQMENVPGYEVGLFIYHDGRGEANEFSSAIPISPQACQHLLSLKTLLLSRMDASIVSFVDHLGEFKTIVSCQHDHYVSVGSPDEICLTLEEYYSEEPPIKKIKTEKGETAGSEEEEQPMEG